MGVGGQRHGPAALPLGKRPGTHFIGGWVGPRAGLDGCGKSRPPPPRDSTTGPSSMVHNQNWFFSTAVLRTILSALPCQYMTTYKTQN